MSSLQFAPALKVHQLDPDLQLRVRELSLTTLGEFRAISRQIRAIQESRWTLRRFEQDSEN